MDTFEFDIVGKIGSMALIRKEDYDLDYNLFSRIGAQLRPGMIWVTSGAVEVGRLDYMHRNGGRQLWGNSDMIKADYAAQGQSILMENYRRFVSPAYSLRQVLVEHQHFNNPEKRDFIKQLLLRSANQNAIPIINYNDTVSFEENRKWEMKKVRSKATNGEEIVECVDNDETASFIASLVHARTLVILTNTDGIYRDPSDPTTLVELITGHDFPEVEAQVRKLQECCVGSSRAGANGAKAKLEYVLEPLSQGTTVLIGNAKYGLTPLLEGKVPHTRLEIR